MTTEELEEDQLETILQGIKIPSPPQLLVDLQMEMLELDPSLDRIAEYITADPGMSGGIIKTVRSPFYGVDEEIGSMKQAVLLLGMKTVMNIITTLSVRSETECSELSQVQLSFMNRFWDSCVDIAKAASLIAMQTRLMNPDIAYMAGMFSNTGIALMMQRFDDYPDVLRESYTGVDKRIVDTENRHYSTNHAVLGYYMAKSWKLPKLVCDVIPIHHNAAELFAKRDDKGSELLDVLATIKLAEHAARMYQNVAGSDQDHEWETIADDVLYYAGLSEDEFIDLVNGIRDQGIGVHSYL